MKISEVLVIAVAGCFFCSLVQPVSTSKTILINADSVRYYASFIHSSATIDDLTIQFGTGTQHEELLRVPIAAPGELLPQAMIRITVGTNPPTVDNDAWVGINDGTNYNRFSIVNHGTISSNPCYTRDGTSNYRTATHGSNVAGTYVILLDPKHRFGACSANNGFESDGKFNTHVDLSKGLDLVVNRDGAQEQYIFHYFLVEFL